MKKWMVIEQYLHDEDSVCKREPRCIPVYLASEVEEELEKARREGIVEGFNKIPDMAHARADERERIVREIATDRNIVSLSKSVDFLLGMDHAQYIARYRPAQEPKLPDTIQPILYAMQKVQDIFSKAIEEVRSRNE